VAKQQNDAAGPRRKEKSMNTSGHMQETNQQPEGGAAVRSSDLLDRAAHVRSIMGSSKDMTWPTPQEWYDYLNLEFGFTLDPCCEHETAKCAKHYTPAEDGLAQSWRDERVFMNPPYGREIGPWMRKAYEEARDNGALVVCFVPARVDTNWWHNYAAKASDIRYPKGRVKNPDGNAWPFPVALVIYRPRVCAV
jgi:site-specific DNA-methyltransferase (adenine-specific)